MSRTTIHRLKSAAVFSLGMTLTALAANAETNLPLPNDDARKELAEEAVEDFYDALSAGKTTTLSSMLTGRYGATKRGVLSVKGYDAELRRNFEGRRIQIYSVNLLGDRNARVSGVLSGTQGDDLGVVLLLELVEENEQWVFKVAGEETTSRL